MRLNKFIAQYSWLSRRAADNAISYGRVTINGKTALVGQSVEELDTVTLDDKPIGDNAKKYTYVVLNKPVGYVCSRNGQGSPTIYSLLTPDLYRLNPVGRLDKDSSGLLLMSDDGDWVNEMTHPKFGHEKHYVVKLHKPISPQDMVDINTGILLEDGMSHVRLEVLDKNKNTYTVTMTEGRNRQIRRTFAARRYMVIELHRTKFSTYTIDKIPKDKHFVFVDK
jgi:23S rRNA pseudouridine2605 synthase